MKLRDKAIDIPQKMGSCVMLTPEEAKILYNLLHKIIGNVR